MDKELINKIQSRKKFLENIECLEKHISEYFKDEEITVFHEILSLDFHLDVYYIKPKESSYDILVTSGMSSLAMTVPDQFKDNTNYQFAELVLLVPKEIYFSDMPAEGKEYDWLISMLKQTARFPHLYNTWLTEGHTLQATYDMQPYCDHTNFVGCIILPSASLDPKFTELKLEDRIINIYNVFPLYKNELEYKIKNGYDAFFDLLIKNNSSDIFNNDRANLLSTL